MSSTGERHAQSAGSTGGEAPDATGSARWRSDIVAGLINAVVSLPDGLASAALAGVNPVYGLYTSMVAPIAGSALVSAQLMQVATTSASALAAAQAIAGYPADQRDQALFLLVLLTGVYLILFGLLRFGRLVRYVSYAVMTGFLVGVAVVLILNQTAQLVGYSPEGANEVVKFVNLLRHVDAFSGRSTIIGVLALAIIIVLGRTKLADLSSLLALVVPTVLMALLGWVGLQLVADVSAIPRGLPALTLPDLTLITPSLLLSAFSLAVVIAVQGAGVSQSVENRDDSPVSASRDMLAQGAANVAAGLFSGIPAGGSVGQTALNVNVGARSRWSGILGGIWMAAIVLLVPGLVGQVPMSVLAALMIMAGIGAIDVREAWSIWQTGGSARAAILVTFVATLLLSVPVAVTVGVGLTIALFVVSAAMNVNVRALVRLDDGRIAEAAPPKSLPNERVTVLDVYGSLFFAGARTMRDALPPPDDAIRPAVVLRLRGRTSVGATLIDELDDYAEELAEAGGRLYLSGVDEDVMEQLRRSGKLEADGNVDVFPADEVIGESTGDAVRAADALLGQGRDDASP